LLNNLPLHDRGKKGIGPRHHPLSELRRSDLWRPWLLDLRKHHLGRGNEFLQGLGALLLL